MNRLRDFVAGRMIPEIDALPFDERQISGLGQDWGKQVGPCAQKACEILNPQFGDALLLYGIPELIRNLIDTLDLAPACARAGLVCSCLDFFYARLRPPTADEICRSESSAEKLRNYVRRRALESVAAGFPKMMAWLAVLQGIPEQWIPSKTISKRLQDLIGRMKITAQVEVALDLRSPIPGGRNWLRRESIADFKALHGQHRVKKPKAAALLIERSGGIEILPVVVVDSHTSACQGTVEYFDPFFPGRVCSASLDLQSGALQSSAPSAYNVYGLMAMFFRACVPSFSTFQALQARLYVAPLLWRLSRLWSLAAIRN